MFFVYLTTAGIKNLNERVNSLEIGHHYTKKLWFNKDRKFYSLWNEEQIIKLIEIDGDDIFCVRVYPLESEWIWAKYKKDFIFANTVKDVIEKLIDRLEL